MQLITIGNLASAEPVLPVRWCLTPKESARIKELRAKNVHILFVTTYEGTDLEDRQLVPIEDMMTYLAFRRPGKSTVFTKIVWSDDKHDMRKTLLDRSSRRTYEIRLVNYERTGLRDDSGYEERFFLCGLDVRTLSECTELEVEIPADHFPPEPPEWLRRLANYGWEGQPFDQCMFRRRLLWLIPKLPALGFWAIITTIIRTVIALVFAISGMREIDFAAVIHPWRNGIEDVGGKTGMWNTWFERKSNGGARSKWVYLLYPWFYIVALVILTLVARHLHMSYLQLLMAMFIGILHFLARTWFLCVSFALSVTILWIIVKATRRGTKIIVERREQKAASPDYQEFLRQKEAATYDELAKLLACSTKPSLPILEELPPERRSLHLRFLDLKAKVCRPYASR